MTHFFFSSHLIRGVRFAAAGSLPPLPSNASGTHTPLVVVLVLMPMLVHALPPSNMAMRGKKGATSTFLITGGIIHIGSKQVVWDTQVVSMSGEREIDGPHHVMPPPSWWQSYVCRVAKKTPIHDKSLFSSAGVCPIAINKSSLGKVIKIVACDKRSLHVVHS